MIKLSTGPARYAGRVRRLRSKLRDERSGRVAFVSHCLLNQNTRYLGGAFRPGAVREVVDPYLRDGIGICQMPCPEQLAWGGVLKRRLLLLYGRPWLGPVIRPLSPVLITFTALRYRLLARRVAAQLADVRGHDHARPERLAGGNSRLPAAPLGPRLHKSHGGQRLGGPDQ